MTTATPDCDLACSQWSTTLDEPLAGTAAPARGYLAIEQGGAWGRDALTDSHLNPEVAAFVAGQTSELEIAPLLIRHPGRALDRDHSDGRTVLAAVSGDRQLLVEFFITRIEELQELDWRAFESGDLTALHPGARIVDEVVALVCAHAKRDRCCALKGRPMAALLEQEHPGLVWECSHLGGHRFAPTALMLPLGAVYGRLDGASLGEAYRAAGQRQVIPELLRGISRYDKAIQAADIAVRKAVGLSMIDALVLMDSHTEESTSLARFHDHLGQRWEVEVSSAPVDQPRPESCGKADASPIVCTVRRLELIAKG